MGGEAAEHVERKQDQDGQEQGVVVEDGESGGLEQEEDRSFVSLIQTLGLPFKLFSDLVLGHLVLLPQNPLVLFLATDLLVVGQLLAHFLRRNVRT